MAQPLVFRWKTRTTAGLRLWSSRVVRAHPGLSDGDSGESVADQLNSSRTQSFSYDQLNRLATANESRWGLSFTYDPWGNFLQQRLTAGYATQHQYTALSNNRLSGYSYDAAGNLLNDTHHQYTFDGKNQIVQVDPQITNGTTTYTYDPGVDPVRK